MDDGAQAVPVVAVVGRPNVGKSSLVNRFLGRREAIVEESPGVTRDRHSFVVEWGGRLFEVVDTGGLEPGATGLDERIVEQAEVAIDTADAVILVVDTVAGPTQDDLVVADALRRSGKPVVVAANKVDDPRDAPLAAAFYRAGLGEPYPVSALHGNGSGDLLEAVVRILPEGRARRDEWASAAIVGRPNVGKSSILNALSGEARAIVDAQPGTTRDPVDTVLDIDGRRIRFVDTAGMRRQVRVQDPIEYFSLLRSRRTLERVDAAILVIDAAEGVGGHEQRIAQEITENGCACVVVFNKWDKIGEEREREWFERDAAQRLRFLPWATVVRTSALSGRGLDKVRRALPVAIESHRRRLPTAEVNRIVRQAQEERPHARTRGRPIRILYAVQAAVSPPRFILFATGEVEPAYVRYVERRIREVEPFQGSPLALSVRLRSRRQAEV